MKLVIDMNLSQDWIPHFPESSYEVIHWSSVGAANAPDSEILKWAREHSAVVLTQDLDFSQILFASQAAGPSVVLLRMDNEFDPETRLFVTQAIGQSRDELVAGALLTVSGRRARMRRLPIGN